MSTLDFVCLILAGWAGFATHRASLCNVKAVAEVLQDGRARMLASLVKAMLWSAMVAGTVIFAIHWPVAPLMSRTPLLLALVGGYVFGVGAAINGGCSLSTVQRLCDGELAMLATVGGFTLGVLLWGIVESGGVATVLANAVSPWARMQGAQAAILILLWAWAAWETVRLWRTVSPLSPLGRMLAPKYQLSSASAVLGLVGGLLFVLHGSWTYTYLLRTEVASVFGMSPLMTWKTMLAAAVIAGMLVSSVQRRSFRLRSAGRKALGVCLLGGTLMGIGAALLPGGNDSLLLTALPALLPSAFGAYASLLAGIASALVLMRGLGKYQTR